MTPEEKKALVKRMNVIRVRMRQNMKEAERRVDFEIGQRHFFAIIEETLGVIKSFIDHHDPHL